MSDNPIKCLHCGAGSDTFFVLQGVQFCGQCSKKITNTTATATATNTNNNNQSNTNTDTTTAAATPIKSTSTSNSAVSPSSPTITFRSDDNPITPVLSRAPSTANTNTDNNAATVQQPNRSIPAFAAASPSPSPLTNKTSPEYLSLVASIRTELESNYSMETEILNMERTELESQLSIITAEKQQLQRTLDESIRAYNTAITDSTNARNDYSANTGILEAELDAARKQLIEAQSHTAAYKSECVELRITADKATATATTLQDQLILLQSDYDSIKAKFDNLHTMATNKLKSAAMEYSTLRNQLNELQAVYTESQTELSTLNERFEWSTKQLAELESNNTNLNQSILQLESELKTKQTELITLNNAYTVLTNTAQQSKSKSEESAAISQRYKEQLLEQRERIRQLESHQKAESLSLSNDAQRLAIELESITAENTILKQKLNNNNNHSNTNGDSTAVIIEQLQSELLSKDTENRELLAMVESLILQVEQAKQQSNNNAAGLLDEPETTAEDEQETY